MGDPSSSRYLVLDPIVNGSKHMRDATSVKNSFIKILDKMNH